MRRGAACVRDLAESPGDDDRGDEDGQQHLAGPDEQGRDAERQGHHPGDEGRAGQRFGVECCPAGNRGRGQTEDQTGRGHAAGVLDEGHVAPGEVAEGGDDDRRDEQRRDDVLEGDPHDGSSGRSVRTSRAWRP
jgi:hypothetical protein